MTQMSTAAPRTHLAIARVTDPDTNQLNITHNQISSILRAEGLRGRDLIITTGQIVGHLVTMRESAEYRTWYRKGHTLDCSGAHSTWTCH